MNSPDSQSTSHPTTTCRVCGRIPDRCSAFIKGGTIEHAFPEAVSRLELWSDVPGYSGDYSVSKADSHIKRCPGCGTFFLYTCSYEYLVNGSEDEIDLERLQDPVALLRGLATHIPGPQRQIDHERELALAAEAADDALRERVRSGLHTDPEPGSLLHWYAAHLAGSSLSAVEVVPYLNDAYRYVLPRGSQTGTREVLPTSSPALPDIESLEAGFRDAGLDQVLHIIETWPVSGTEQATALVCQTLRQHRHFLQRHPETFFQVLYNACYWRDCPEAGRHYDYPLGLCRPASLWENDTIPLWAWVEAHRRRREGQADHPWFRACHPLPRPFGPSLDLVLTAHRSEVGQAFYDPSGTEVISCTKDGEVIRWDAATGEIRQRFQAPETLASGDISADGRHLATVGRDGMARIWELPGVLRLEMPVPEGFMVQTWFTGCGILVFQGSESQLWDPIRPALVRSLPGKAPRLSADGQRVAWHRGGWNDKANGWVVELFVSEVTSGKRLLSVEVGGDHYGLLSPDGCWLAAVRDDRNVEIDVWDVDRQRVLRSLPVPEPRFYVRPQFFSPDGRLLFILQGDGHGREIVWVWDVQQATGAKLDIWQKPLTFHFSVSKDSRRLAVGGPWAGMSVFDLRTRTEMFRFPDEPAYLQSVRLRQDGLAMLTAFDKSVRVRDLRPEAYLRPQGHREPVIEVRAAPSGIWFLSRSADEVRVWDPKTGETLLVLRTRSHAVRFSRRGRNLVVTVRGRDGSGYESIRDVQTGRLVRRRADTRSGANEALPEMSSFEVRVQGEDSAVFIRGGQIPLAWIPGRVTSAVWAGRSVLALTEEGELLLYELYGNLNLPADPATANANRKA